jgi:hypothetical protein
MADDPVIRFAVQVESGRPPPIPGRPKWQSSAALMFAAAMRPLPLSAPSSNFWWLPSGTGYPGPDLCLLLPFAQASAASAVMWLGWFGCEIRPAASASATRPDLLSARSESLRSVLFTLWLDLFQQFAHPAGSLGRDILTA